ncbi:hypothetical protein NECAME_16027 [Necator americanus]|uniref:Uncharacterized protein n=1 Tax=Necator americanus TaxID=51031 RepID=W2TYN3_NECAM|nr:hypothetical protein NECAME_16027 [Necator americanus]ETN86963.1 hypothetical protein NECAME_16027 [Necator americanus]
MNPYYIMISSTPLTIQLKIKLTLTTAIALQRTLALVAPVFYRKLSATLYDIGALLLGIIFACIDLLLEFALSPIKESPNCGTIGCFVSDRFLYYWGTSNMCNVKANRTSLGILLTSLFFITIPSVGVGFLEMIGISIFRKVGPFYTVGLLCAASCNGIVYVVLNSDMRKMARGMLSNQQSSSTLFVSTTNKPTPSTLRTQQH